MFLFALNVCQLCRGTRTAGGEVKQCQVLDFICVFIIMFSRMLMF